jgi:hypothetical protein
MCSASRQSGLTVHWNHQLSGELTEKPVVRVGLPDFPWRDRKSIAARLRQLLVCSCRARLGNNECRLILCGLLVGAVVQTVDEKATMGKLVLQTNIC